jgi:Flp pilus assembly protein TadB
MTTYLIALAVGAIALTALYFSIRKDGKNAEKLNHAEKNLANINKANKARRRLRDDVSYANRLRNKFTRK